MEAGGRRVVAVGAGLAGLGAAQRLRGHGSLRLLEAAARAGGRVCTRPFASGLAEMGAHWIHGPSPGNPVFCLASRYGLLGPEAAREENQQVEAGGHPPMPSVTYGSSGKVLSPKAVREARDLFYALLASTRAFQGSKEPPWPSVGQYMRAEIARTIPKKGGGQDDARRLQLAVLAACLKLECCISGTHSMDLVALEPFGEYVSLPGLDCTFPGGYSSLSERLLSDLPEGTVLLNKAVKTIQWQGSFREGGDSARVFPVRVECEDGDVFLADHVIVTVPLGFLKERHQELFQPPLPKRKAEAIRHLGFGTNNKIFLEFEQPFWEPHQQLLEVVWEDESALEEPSADLEANWFKKLIGFVVLQPPEQYVPGGLGTFQTSSGRPVGTGRAQSWWAAALSPTSPPQARARPVWLHRGEGVGVHGDAERRRGAQRHDPRPPHDDRESEPSRAQERAPVPLAQRSLHPRLLQLCGRRQLGGRHRCAGTAPARGPRGPPAPAAPLRRRGHAPHLLLHHPRGAAVGVARGRAAQPAPPGARPAPQS